MNYIAIDGDNIGRELEILIILKKLKKLQKFSKDFSKSMKWLEKSLTKANCSIIFVGGDSLLCASNMEIKKLIPLVKDINTQFEKKFNFTFSGGIGSDPERAYIALKLAKGLGKNRIHWYEK